LAAQRWAPIEGDATCSAAAAQLRDGFFCPQFHHQKKDEKNASRNENRNSEFYAKPLNPCVKDAGHPLFQEIQQSLRTCHTK